MKSFLLFFKDLFFCYFDFLLDSWECRERDRIQGERKPNKIMQDRGAKRNTFSFFQTRNEFFPTDAAYAHRPPI